MAKKKMLVNFSGHPLPEAAQKSLGKKYEIVDYEVPNLDVTSSKALVNSTISLMATFVGEHSAKIKTGDFEIVFPGLSPVAIMVLTTLHGFSGHFPKFRWTYRTDNGFAVSEALDLQKIRLDARADRFFV